MNKERSHSLGGTSRIGLISILVIVAAFCFGACSKPERVQAVYPQAQWLRYETPEEAGWSSERLQKAESLWREIDSDAFMVVYDGAVVVAWGDVKRRFMCHSVRKSFLSALYGIHAASGAIRLDKTLAEMNIDDEPPLTPGEKQATILDLLEARSGVYHAAAYETPGMKERRPSRGSKKPGEFWYYNNWDFNALCTIFEQETQTKIFEEFQERIAKPLQMQDFRLMDTYYHVEKQHSIHPAYPFKMSARDMARFGLLYLRNGNWNERQIIPAEWVEQTSHAYTDSAGARGRGYGYMWWVRTDSLDKKYGMYSARGVGGQMISVLPSYGVVFVNRADTYYGKTTNATKLDSLMDLVLEAKRSTPKSRPRRVPLDDPEVSTPARASDISLREYEATFQLDREEVFVETIPYVIGDMIGHTVSMEPSGSNLLLTDNLGQRLNLLYRSKTEFELEDSRIPVFFEFDAEGRLAGITLDATPSWKVAGRILSQ